MPRETVLTRLRRELEQYKNGTRIREAQLVSTRAERDHARGLAADHDIAMRRNVALERQNARLEGYIDRVREVDGTVKPSEAPSSAALFSESGTIRPREAITAEDIANMSDKEFEKLLLTSKPRLDALMGRNAGDIDD